MNGFLPVIWYFLPLVIAVVAITTRALDYKGILAGLVIAYITLITQNVYWLIVMLGFFIVATLATRYKEKRKLRYKTEKQRVRTSKHVLANGIVAALMAVIALYHAPFAIPAFFGFIGALATATADTLSSEVGMLSKSTPRLITTFKKVPTGTEGAISFLGTVIAFLGAAFIGLLGLLVFNSYEVFVIAVTAGVVGCFIDSFIGATLETKKYVKNWGTNLIATISGGTLGFALSFLL